MFRDEVFHVGQHVSVNNIVTAELWSNFIRLESGRYWCFQSYQQMLITDQGNFSPVLISTTLHHLSNTMRISTPPA